MVQNLLKLFLFNRDSHGAASYLMIKKQEQKKKKTSSDRCIFSPLFTSSCKNTVYVFFSLEAWWHCHHVWQGTENKRLFQRVTDFYEAKMRHCDWKDFQFERFSKNPHCQPDMKKDYTELKLLVVAKTVGWSKSWFTTEFLFGSK